jgi:hypothetical protein
MYEYNMFDFMSIEPIGDYGIKELDKSFADFNDIKNHRYSVHNNIITTDNKYVGIIPSYYYCGHLEEFNKLLLYFANTIFKKYGLYFQHSMSVLIELCKDYKLPYLKILYKALKEAKNIDYPNNHSFNYDGFNIRKKVDWYL